MRLCTSNELWCHGLWRRDGLSGLNFWIETWQSVRVCLVDQDSVPLYLLLAWTHSWSGKWSCFKQEISHWILSFKSVLCKTCKIFKSRHHSWVNFLWASFKKDVRNESNGNNLLFYWFIFHHSWKKRLEWMLSHIIRKTNSDQVFSTQNSDWSPFLICNDYFSCLCHYLRFEHCGYTYLAQNIAQDVYKLKFAPNEFFKGWIGLPNQLTSRSKTLLQIGLGEVQLHFPGKYADYTYEVSFSLQSGAYRLFRASGGRLSTPAVNFMFFDTSCVKHELFWGGSSVYHIVLIRINFVVWLDGATIQPGTFGQSSISLVGLLISGCNSPTQLGFR